MAIIIRIDVDRPYGRKPLLRHVLSRLSSDLWCPTIHCFGYLSELNTMLGWLNSEGARAHVFFRRCTMPCKALIEVLDKGGHDIGLHLENSRSFATFLEEKKILEQCVGRNIVTVSKHGSGGGKFGFHHYPPYEPERYVEWAGRASLRLFLGNLEDPSLDSEKASNGVQIFPAAFWLEPGWRDTEKFTVDWLLQEARYRDIVLLVHPENTLADPKLVSDFKRVISTIESRIIH